MAAASDTTPLFRNRDRVRVHLSEVTHLRSGRVVPLEGPPVTTLVRTVLTDLFQKVGERIDLSAS